MKHIAEGSCLVDVEQYPQNLMLIHDDCVQIQVTYKKVWDDEFGARGWKLNATIGDPEIIASTRETGQKISTSAFIHDILDHFLSGFGVSGHGSEAMALIQLSKRKHITRPAIANERLKRNSAGDVVLQLKSPYQDGTTHIVMSPLEFMQRLAALVPRPRLNLIRFHGVLAPHAKLRSEIIPSRSFTVNNTSDDLDDAPHHASSARMSWARLLKRVFDIDIEH